MSVSLFCDPLTPKCQCIFALGPASVTVTLFIDHKIILAFLGDSQECVCCCFGPLSVSLLGCGLELHGVGSADWELRLSKILLTDQGGSHSPKPPAINLHQSLLSTSPAFMTPPKWVSRAIAKLNKYCHKERDPAKEDGIAPCPELEEPATGDTAISLC